MRKYFDLLIGRLGPKFHIARSHAKARYYVVERIGRAIEVRRYDSRIAAEASVPAKDAATGGDEAFRIIGDYVSGANQGGIKLPIAFPIETTGRFLVRPVVGSAIEVIKMRFFLQPAITLDDAPRPLDPQIRVVQSRSSVWLLSRFEPAGCRAGCTGMNGCY